MRTSIRDRVILVTGAARGIGEHTARLAAAQGARLALVGLEPDLLAALAEELNAAEELTAAEADGPRHVWFAADVTDQDELDRAVAGTVEALGGIDVVVANAGITNHGTVAVNPADALARTVEVNLIGAIRTVAATLPQVTARRGYFLLVSSAAAFAALPGMAAYCAAKAGVEQFGNALRLEVAHLGVRVGTAHPVWVDTDMVRDAKADLPTFRAALGRLPWPLNTNVPVRQCAAAFVVGIQRRRRRIYVPGPVWLVQALRTVILSPLGDAILRRSARRGVPQMEADVRAAGRTFGEHSVESLTGRGRQPGEEANV